MMKFPVFFALFLTVPVLAQNWTVTVRGQTTDNAGNAVVSLHFSGDAGGLYDVDDHIPLGAPTSQLADFAANTITALNDQQAALAIAPIVGSTVTPTNFPGPSVNLFAIQEATFLRNFLLLRQYKEAINYGLITSTDTSYVSVLSSATAEYAVIKDTVTPILPATP